MILSELPAEIIYLVATHLPTANALVCLARTCRRLGEIIAGEDWRILRAFVQGRFSNIPTPPLWQDAAQALTSRSRALDRNAVVARFVRRPSDAEQLGGSPHPTRNDNPTHGYRPAIDSYEIWDGPTWHDRREVVAFNAAHEVVLQIRQTGSRPMRKSFVFNELEHISSHDDIRGIHLLRPEHDAKDPDQEHVIFGRMRGELVHIAIDPEEGIYDHKQNFHTAGLEIVRTDMSEGSEPTLAVQFTNGRIAMYSTTSDDREVRSFGEIDSGTSIAIRSSKFLSSTRFAVATGRAADPITISTISNERISLESTISPDFMVPAARNGHHKRSIVTAIAPLTGQTGASPGNTFLAAWGDGATRLHDLRSHKPYENLYIDIADQNPTYCIHPFGHDRFVLGAGGDALVKLFDLRMPQTYNYLDAKHKPPQSPIASAFSSRKLPPLAIPTPKPSKDLSLFLSYSMNVRHTRHRYRGAIYTMSSPSLLSPTIYTGVAGSVIRLDFASTDDLLGPNKDWYRDSIDLDLHYLSKGNEIREEIIEISGYERPDAMDTTTTSKLRSQKAFWELDERNLKNEAATGWDRRWRPLEAPGAWRRRDFRFDDRRPRPR
ncbi:uncharacterized protein BDV14DRAFT_176024 [Aspergillus stella-maris]|uniref:uncharacterized protein n=1 Tax=Aspergillus stella-maris TaxID=1810926 RepID=UPI003CCDDB0B